jgi:uncharacterized protein (TIGR03086 family)
MASTLDRYDVAADGFRRRLEPLGDTEFNRTSPCEGWSAGEVVDHASDVLVLVGDYVGDPVEKTSNERRLDRFDQSSRALRSKVADDGLSLVVVDSPFGRLALKQLVSSVVIHDLLVHTWDLARATGGDERLDAELVAHTLASMTPFDEMLRGHGFGPKVEPPEGADLQTQLLCFLGRNP